jgi:hypothetical protein
MSEVAQVALITGGVGFLSVLFSLWFNARAKKDDQDQRAAERREDYQEWYKRTLFEKQLTAVKEAYSWVIRIHHRAHEASSDSGDRESLYPDDTRTLQELCAEARQWHDDNTVFLYDDFPHGSPFIGLLNAAFAGDGEFFQQCRRECEEMLRERRASLLKRADPNIEDRNG